MGELLQQLPQLEALCEKLYNSQVITSVGHILKIDHVFKPALRFHLKLQQHA